MESMHIVFVLAMILPVIYMLGMKRTDNMVYRLYFCNYIIFLPVFLVKCLVNRCRNVMQYALLCAASLGGTVLLAIQIKNVALEKDVWDGYLLGTLLESVVAMATVYGIRLNHARQKRALEEENRPWKKKEYSLEKPMISITAWFVVCYLLAANFNCPQLCNISLFSSVIYLLLAVGYQYLDRTEMYLMRHENVCNIPKRRIYGIGKANMFLYLLLLVLVALPAIFSMNRQEYKDFRTWIVERGEAAEQFLEEEQPVKKAGDPMMDVVDAYGEPEKLPLWVEIIFYSVPGLVVIYLLFLFIKMLKEQLSDFRRGFDDNGDKAEMLIIQNETEERINRKRNRRNMADEGERVRYLYRKMIRKNRKEMPKPSETPEEMEEKAGIVGKEEVIKLHEQYEEVRYGKMS